MVILADAQGVLMHTLGDLDFLNKADRVALKCGATWAENQRGTNAIGTAVAEANRDSRRGTLS
jgi:transcriptional regulator of acetoin/glycerol metabolism